MTRSIRAVAAVALALAWIAPASAGAQTLYGSIVGTVTDAQGAATPGVTLTAVNKATGHTIEARTDETGEYAFRNLLPGTYDLKATLSGFKEHQQTGIPVSAGNPVRVNIALAVGGLEERIDVVSQTTLIQTEKADLNTELSSKEIVSLPLNGYRNYQALMNLVPGATPFQEQNALIDTPGRSLRTWVNGTQPNSNATRIDGAVSVNIWLPHHVGYVQPAETIDTVNISTNNFDADQGMAGGAASTVITKSGTNNLRGSGFWFGNRDELNANTLSNNANKFLTETPSNFDKPPLARDIYGGTVGGPIVKNRLFYFGSWERYSEQRGSNATYTVPSLKMRDGDFSEVAANYPAFRLYNPFTGGAGGTGRDQFGDFRIPGAMISNVARAINALYPKPNTGDVNRNLLLDDYVQRRVVDVARDNYDVKLTFQRTSAHSIWGKFAMLDAEVLDNFILGFDQGSTGDTRNYVVGVGHTWTFSPTMVLDGNFGANIMNQTVTGPDYGRHYGLDVGLAGTNGPDIRQSGLPQIANGYTLGTTPNWMPLFRNDRSYTVSSALTKVFPKHEVRAGVDVVRHQLNHYQAEFGTYGVRGGLAFAGNITGAPAYTALTWNSYAAFLLGLSSSFAKDTQTELMTGREWQNAVYVRDRWNVNQKLTLSLGVRMEHYPLMSRADRGLERLDLSTYEVLIGGKGGVPKDVGLNVKSLYFAPRIGAMYRITENSVFRAGYGQTVNPLPWSRPLRGSFPQDVNFNRSAEQFDWTTTLEAGIPTVVIPDINLGRVKLPLNVFMRTPNPDDLDRAIIQQWNVAYERRLPGNISAEIAYVGTRTDQGYADLNINYGEPGGGNAARKYFALAGTTAINDWAARTISRYQGLQLQINRPFQNGLLLKGAYTFSRSKDMTANDEDGWTSLDYNHPMVYDLNYALAGFDRTHNFQMGWVYELPFLKENKAPIGQVLGGWQVNGVFGAYSGTPYSIGGTNNAMNCQACGSIRISVSEDPKPIGSPGSATEPYYPIEIFSQPVGLDKAGFGTSGRNRFRRPPVWNLDLGIFKSFNVGRFRPEIRIESRNVLNHPNWGAPVTGFTALNFMRFTPGSAESGTNSPGARTMQIGLRLQF
jgi:carboxypeptidase family protein